MDYVLESCRDQVQLLQNTVRNIDRDAARRACVTWLRNGTAAVKELDSWLGSGKRGDDGYLDRILERVTAAPTASHQTAQRTMPAAGRIMECIATAAPTASHQTAQRTMPAASTLASTLQPPSLTTPTSDVRNRARNPHPSARQFPDNLEECLQMLHDYQYTCVQLAAHSRALLAARYAQPPPRQPAALAGTSSR